MFSDGFLTGERCHLRLGWGFCDGGDGNGGGRFRIGDESCCEAGLGQIG